MEEYTVGAFRLRWLMPVRVAAMCGLIVVALFSSYGIWKQTRALSQRAAPDDVSAYEARFAPAKQLLPKNGIVCYLPDFSSSESAKRDFFLARYALAPLVVRTVPDCDPLIANFPTGVPPSLLLSNKYSVLEDFGNGVLLLKRNDR
jgi:hypothetical protein